MVILPPRLPIPDLSRFPYRRFIWALVLGAAGGWLFARLNMPLPWMLGSMLTCTVGALLRAPIAAPPAVRPPMTMIIGAMLGSAFAPEILSRVPFWLPSILGLALFLALSGVACVAYFRLVAGFDWPTAYFSGMPGGLAEMVIIGDQNGGDARNIALVHSARVLLIVFTLPFLVQILEGVAIGSRGRLGVSLLEGTWTSLLWFAATAVAGALVGRLARLPAPYLLGPMLVSALVHLAGLTDFVPPYEIINAAQVVLGATIGCRFLGTPPRYVLRIIVLSLGSTALLLAVTLAVAVVVGFASAYGAVPLMLAYSPGGLAEMSLVAVALNIEVAFVAAHHVIRMFLVVAAAGPVFALLHRKQLKGRGPDKGG